MWLKGDHLQKYFFFLQIIFFLFFIYTVIELVKMSSSSNLQYEEIPKKYIDPLAPKDKGEGSRVNGKDWKIKKDAFRKDFGSGFENKKDSFKQRELKRLKKNNTKQD